MPYQKEECNTINIPYTTVETKEKQLFHVKDYSIGSMQRLIQKADIKADALVNIYFKAEDTLNLWAYDDEGFSALVESGYTNGDANLLKRESFLEREKIHSRR